MKHRVRSWLLLGLALPLGGCLSFCETQEYQPVTWADGDASRVEVWVRGGDMRVGVLGFLADVLATPLLVPLECYGAWEALTRDDLEITAGPFGFVLCLLPGLTCIPVPLVEHRTSYLRLHEPLQLPVAAREELARCGDKAGIEWLLRQYIAAEPAAEARWTARVHYWVSAVRLVPPAPPPSPPPEPSQRTKNS